MVRNGRFGERATTAIGEEEDMAQLASENLPPRGRDNPWTMDELYAADTRPVLAYARRDGRRIRGGSPDLFDVSVRGGGRPIALALPQKIRDPAGDLDWRVEGEVDVEASEEEGGWSRVWWRSGKRAP